MATRIQRYPFYDTARLQTSVGVITMFNTAEGNDATHQGQDTNMRVGGNWVESEDVVIDCIKVFRDGAWILNDIPLVYQENYLKVYVAQENVLQLPLSLFIANDSFSGIGLEATQTDAFMIGKQGYGYKLDIPIEVAGGTAFKVEFHQVTAIATANSLVKVVLETQLHTKVAR